MRLSRVLVTWSLVIAALVVIVPAGALASGPSAGDQQYVDPLSGTKTTKPKPKPKPVELAHDDYESGAQLARTDDDAHTGSDAHTDRDRLGDEHEYDHVDDVDEERPVVLEHPAAYRVRRLARWRVRGRAARCRPDTPPAPWRNPLVTTPVLINGRAVVRAQIGGVERFARELALRLPALRPDRYRVIRPPPGLAHRAGHVWEQAILPIRAARAPLIFSPANLAPAVGPRNAVVIHDAAALRHPEAYSRAYVAYQHRMLPLIARRARLLFTVSGFARGELVDLLGVDPERVTVIPEGVDRRFSPDADPAPARLRHNLTEPYVLALGTISDRKNLSVLDTAARALRERGSSSWPQARGAAICGAAPPRRSGGSATSPNAICRACTPARSRS